MSKNIIDFIKNSPYVLADGAMGTYFTEVSGLSADRCELANIEAPDTIKKIHEEYIAAGSQILRTNTFAANTHLLKKDQQTIETILRRGFEIASSTAKNKEVYVLADIGPIPELEDYDVLEEYRRIVDIFFDCGATNFIFETFSCFESMLKVCEYIKSKDNKAFILTQFAVGPDGYTRKGISGENIIEAITHSKVVDSYGFNCRSGPMHLLDYIRKLNITSDKTIDILSVMPNAGYPSTENERTLFLNNPQYFAHIMSDIKNSGVKILGGCCGTTPKHISETLKAICCRKNSYSYKDPIQKKESSRSPVKNSFFEKLNSGEKVIAVELDPPLNAKVANMIEGAKTLKQHNVDIITIADCPLSRARVDSSILASKIKREANIETLPHMTCRDRNLNAIKALLLGIHVENIRNILTVTGDPIPAAERSDVKGVFNLNSFMFAEFVKELNKNEFKDDEIYIGGALNINATNFDVELKRAKLKLDKGVSYFLTQPAFTDASFCALKKAKETLDCKILGGVLPIVSYRNAIFLNNEIPGIKVPENITSRFEGKEREEAEVVGIEIAIETCKKVLSLVDGVYIVTPFNRWKMICKIINGLKD